MVIDLFLNIEKFIQFNYFNQIKYFFIKFDIKFLLNQQNKSLLLIFLILMKNILSISRNLIERTELH